MLLKYTLAIVFKENKIKNLDNELIEDALIVVILKRPFFIFLNFSQ